MRTKISRLLLTAILTVAAAFSYTAVARAQGNPPGISAPRTLAELKAEVQRRADNELYPENDMDSADVREALTSIGDLQPETWGKAWIALGDRYAAKGDWWRAFVYYDFGHFPARTSPAKQAAYDKTVDAFTHYGATLSPPVRVVRLPFEGKTIVVYVRVPAHTGRIPAVLTIGALDDWKEKMMLLWSPLLDNGIALVAVDMPGTGQAPILVEPHAERMFGTILDWMTQQPEFDASRFAVAGVSWSSYWSEKLAFTEKDRIRGIASLGSITDGYFQPEWQRKALGTREYLFDLFAARATVYGVSTLDDFLAFGPKMSLVAQGYVGKPSAPMLLINGVKDTQVPIDDLFLLLRTGSPKDAWVNPDGGHTGISREWGPDAIITKIAAPWFLRLLKGDAAS